MAVSRTRYVPALDGLRAFAVLAVIAYHFGFPWASGGLLGVTVFFVLSGYLITSLLLAEWDSTKTIDLKAFWLRRAKRLLPAIVFLLVGVAALCAVFNHELLTKMRPDVVPSLFFYGNWWNIFHDISYFEALGSPSPLTHFWSLAIEEQFYLVWPVLLFILFGRGTKKKTVSRITLVLTVVSVVLMAVLYDPNQDPSRVYYGTDTRAFSILIGALLAFAWPSGLLNEKSGSKMSPGESLLFNGVGFAALIGLFVMVATVDGFSAFPYYGGILLASLLTAAVIAVMVHPKSILGKIGALPPLVWIGKRSFGMYLWHYPIILLMNPRNYTGDVNIFYILLQVLVIFAISAFSYRFIEDPIRKGSLGRFFAGLRAGKIDLSDYLRTHIVPTAGAAVIAVVALGGFAFIPPTGGIAGMDELQEAAASNAPPSEEQIASDQKTYNIVLVGDSVSVRAIPYFEETFPDGLIDSAVSRPLYSGTLVYDYYKDLNVIGDIVVFSLGTNGPATDEQLDDLINDVGPDRQIYLINTRSPQQWVQTTNEALGRAAERFPNVSVIDWYSLSSNHDDWFDGDGTHLTEEGAQVYVEMVREATGLPKPEPAVAEDGSANAAPTEDSAAAADDGQPSDEATQDEGGQSA